MHSKKPVAARRLILKATGVRKSFGDTEILHGIDVSVCAGELLSIMGPSGSGKSSLLYCLAGVMEPDGGEVTYDGRRLSALRKSQKTRLRRSDFGFIFQFGELVPELPVRDNVALPLLLNRVKKKQAYRTADQWIEAVGLMKQAGNFPHTLSGGETQRVAVARAMAIDPAIIFADEPTGSLDSKNSNIVMDLLVRLAKEHGKAVVFVTHSQALANYADVQVVMRDGILTNQEKAE